jgi:uncharacterized protein
MKRILYATLALTLLIASAAYAAPSTPSAPTASAVRISQVYGGGGNSGATLKNDFIELFNSSTSAVSLAGWSVQYASSAGSTWQVTALSGSIAPGAYYLVQEAQGAGGTVDLPTPDATGSIAMSATSGKVALVSDSTALTGTCPTTVVDFVGYGAANCFEGSAAAPTLTNTTAALRAGSGCQDTDSNSADFASGTPDPRNSSSPINSCGVELAPSVTSTTPADQATNVPVTANITVFFSEPVTLAGPGWLDITCTFSGSHNTGGLTGGDTIFTFNPDTDFAQSESCTATVFASQVTDQDTDDPPDNMTADYVWSFTTAAPPCTATPTAIGLIQGTGAAFDPAYGGTQTVRGVVVGDYEGASPALRGFYIQNPPSADDDDPTTSDGIFIYESDNADRVSLGQLVQVTGNVSENQDQTQISSTSVEICPPTQEAMPLANVTLPFSSADFLERYEGMLVLLPQTLYVTEHFQLGRFGQVVMSSGVRLQQPTAVVAPGAPALALQAANDLNRLIVDDALNNQNPDPILFGRNGNPLSAGNTLRGGDTATGLSGVLTYTWSGNSASGNAYRVRPINAWGGYVNFQPANPRPEAAPDPGGTVRVAGMNLLNFFNTFDGIPDTVDNCTNGVGGTPTDCRGADTPEEFARQWPKTVAAIVKTGADVIAFSEIENDGYGPDSAIRFLVDKLNDATAAGMYAFIDADAGAGQVNALGLDAIKVGLLYKPGRVTPVGTTAALNTATFVNGGDAVLRNRPALAQAFEQADGERFIVLANHLKSKGSACEVPDAGDGQGNCNVVRTNAVSEMLAWLATDPTGTGEEDVLIMGDLNSYAREDPITTLEAGGYINLIRKYGGDAAYGYVFDGQWGYLDHALASDSLVRQVKGVAEYHINADEPSVLDYNTDFKSAGQIASLYALDEFRMSDHDAVLVGLRLGPQYRVFLPLVEKPGQPVDMLLLPKFMGLSLFDDANHGAQEAHVELRNPGRLTYTGPTADNAVAGQIAIVTNAPGLGYKALMISDVAGDQIVPAVQAARAQGLTVVTWDSPIPSAQGEQVYVAPVDFAETGETMAEMARDILGAGAGKFVVLSAAPDAANQNAWIADLKEVLKDPKYANLELIDVVYGNDQYDLSYDLALGLVLQYPDMKLIMAPTVVGIQAAAQAMQDTGRCATVKVSGLGLPSDMAQYTENGCAPEFALWSFVDLGYLTYYVTYRIATDQIQGQEGTHFEAGRLGSYVITRDPNRDQGLRVLLGPFTIYTKDNLP